MALLIETFRVFRDMARGYAGWRRRQSVRFEHAVLIEAPRATVWQMLRSRDITFDGLVPMRVISEVVAGRPDLEKGRIILGDREIALMIRIVEERPDKALLLEIVTAGSDPAVVMGADDFMGFVLDDTPGGTLLSLTRELVPGRISAILQVPVGLRSGAGRYRKTAEAMAAANPLEAGATAGMPGVAAATTTALGQSGTFRLVLNDLRFKSPRLNSVLLSLVALASFACGFFRNTY